MNNSPRRVNKIALVLIAVFALAIVGVIIFALAGKNRLYTSWETTASFDNISDPLFIRTDKGYVAFNRDGAECHTGDGNVLWRLSFSMSDPVADAEGEYAAFGDRGGQEVHVTDGSGANHLFSVPEKIVQICVADGGITAVRTNAGDSDQIYLYDFDGNMLLDLRTDVRKSGFPITMALSNDGKRLVTSYYEVGQENKSWLTFYNFGDVGQNYADKIVGSFSYDEKLMVDVRFLDGSRVAVFSSDSCDLYKFREVPELVTNIKVDGGIEAVCGSSTGFAVAGRDSDQSNNVTVYDLNGKAVSTIKSSMGFDTMRIENDELILTVDDSCVIYRKNGDEKFRARFNDVIRLIYPVSKNAEYMVVGENRSELIRLRTLKEDAAIAANEE